VPTARELLQGLSAGTDSGGSSASGTCSKMMRRLVPDQVTGKIIGSPGGATGYLSLLRPYHAGVGLRRRSTLGRLPIYGHIAGITAILDSFNSGGTYGHISVGYRCPLPVMTLQETGGYNRQIQIGFVECEG
jgi:hypothetical protein